MTTIKNPITVTGLSSKEDVQVTNGILQKCVGTDTISAGTLVELVNTKDFEISPMNDTASSVVAVALSGNTFLALYAYGADRYLYGIICSVKGRNITRSEPIPLISEVGAGGTISAVALSDSRVFIAHSRGLSYSLYGAICSVADGNIVLETDEIISADAYAGHSISTALLDESRVFIAHSYASSYQLRCVVCDIQNNNILVGTEHSASTVANTGDIISAVALSQSKVAVLHSYGTNYRVYAIVYTIDGLTLTAGADVSVSDNNGTGRCIAAVATSENTIRGITETSTTAVRALILASYTVNGTTVTRDSYVSLSANKNTAPTAAIVNLGDNDVSVAYSNGGSELYWVLASISGTGSTIKTDKVVASLGSSGQISIASLSDYKMVVLHSYGDDNQLRGLVISEYPIVAPATSDEIYGITNTRCTADKPGEVWVLD